MPKKKTVFSILRSMIGIGLASGIVYGIIRSSDLNLWKVIAQANFSLLFLALLMFGIVAFLSSYRLNLLLNTQKINLSLWETMRLTLMGIFFNLALPGAVSGDVMKMYLLARNTKTQKERSILTVFLDRAIGLTGLLIVAFVVFIFSVRILSEIEGGYRIVKIAVYIVGLGSLCGIGCMVLMVWREKVLQQPLVAGIMYHGKRLLPIIIVTSIERLGNALKLYRKNKLKVFWAISISIVIHAVLALNLYCIGVSVGEKSSTVNSYFIAVPVANVVATLPLTPGGIGTRDLTIAVILKSMIVLEEKAVAIPVIFTLVIVFWGLVGGIIFIGSRDLKFAVRDDRSVGQQI